MLILTRGVGESIYINDVKVKFVAFKGDGIKLGIDAPREIPVHREEIYNKIKQAKNQN